MSRYIRLIIVILAALGLSALLLVILPAQQRLLASNQTAITQAAITVNTLEDEDNNDGDCSLREALHAANDNIMVDACPAGDSVISDTITFSVSGTIQLTAGLTVTAGGPLLIDGAGEITTSGKLDGRHFYVNSGARLTLERLVLVDGYAFNGEGGSIFNLGTLTITESILTGNRADYGGAIFNEGGMVNILNSLVADNHTVEDGGGIYTLSGTLRLVETTLSANQAYSGGGIYNVGTSIVSILNSTFSNNTGLGSPGGGGIFNQDFSRLTITNTILSNNRASYGGGISNRGTLTITDSTLSANTTENANGGGIYNETSGKLNIGNTIVSDNTANYGGGVFNVGFLKLTNTTISGNHALENGGGINNFRVMTITNSILTCNSSDGYGGGIHNSGALTITDTSLSENSAGFLGGGIYNLNSLILTNSSLTDNSITGIILGGYQGGGIYNDWAGTVSIMDSILSGNSVTGEDIGSSYAGGGINNYGMLTVSSSTISDNVAEEGGGIFNGGVLTITNTTLSENTGLYFGGGIYNGNKLTISNSTLSGNNGADGGGVYNSLGTLYMTNTTLSGNSAGTGGGIHNDAALTVTNSTVTGNSSYYVGGIYVDTWASLSLSGSIVSGNYSGSTIHNCAGITPTMDAGYNIEDGWTCHLNPEEGSLTNTDPLLGPLQDNGGPTWTHALLYDSPAIDAGDPVSCPATDQRGVARPLDGDADGEARCDMGAYEFDPRIELQPAYDLEFNLIGTAVGYSLELYNYTLLTDTYTLAPGPHTWETSLSTDSLGPLSNGESQPFTVTVSIPLTATAFTTDTVIITATSVTQPALYLATAQINTLAVEKIWKISLPLVARRE